MGTTVIHHDIINDYSITYRDYTAVRKHQEASGRWQEDQEAT